MLAVLKDSVLMTLEWLFKRRSDTVFLAGILGVLIACLYQGIPWAVLEFRSQVKELNESNERSIRAITSSNEKSISELKESYEKSIERVTKSFDDAHSREIEMLRFYIEHSASKSGPAGMAIQPSLSAPLKRDTP